MCVLHTQSLQFFDLARVDIKFLIGIDEQLHAFVMLNVSCYFLKFLDFPIFRLLTDNSTFVVCVLDQNAGWLHFGYGLVFGGTCEQ